MEVSDLSDVFNVNAAGIFIVVGRRSTGKTHLLRRIARLCTSRGQNVRWVSRPEDILSVDVRNAVCLIDDANQKACAMEHAIKNAGARMVILSMSYVHRPGSYEFADKIIFLEPQRDGYIRVLAGTHPKWSDAFMLFDGWTHQVQWITRAETA